MIPNKWSKFNKYVTCYNKVTNLTQETIGNKPWVFKLVVTTDSDVDIKDIVEEDTIDMAQDSLLIEVRCPQVVHSKKGLLATMLPENMNLVYIQKHAQRCIIEGVHKTTGEGRDPPTRKGLNQKYGDFKVLVDLSYPPSNFKCQKKGTKINYSPQNK